MSEYVDQLADDLRAAFNGATDSPNQTDFPTLADMPEYPRERWRAVARRAVELGAAGVSSGDRETTVTKWLKRKLRPLLFRAWEWTWADEDDEGLLHDDGLACPGAGCNDPSCPSWG